MKKQLMIATLLVSAFTAQAELVNSDWKSSGDNYMITDTNTGIKWLSLELTLGKSVNDLDGSPSFSGFEVASEDAMQTLATSYLGYPDLRATGPFEDETLEEESLLRSFSESFGVYVMNEHNIYSYGIYSIGEDQNHLAGVFTYKRRHKRTTSIKDDDYSYSNFGVYMMETASYQNWLSTVPEKLEPLPEETASTDTPEVVSNVNAPVAYAMGLLSLCFAGFRRGK